MQQPEFHPDKLANEVDRVFLTPVRSCAALTSSYLEAVTQYQLKTLSTYVDIAGKGHRAALGVRSADDVQRSLENLAEIGQELRGQMESDQAALLHLNRTFSDSFQKFASEAYRSIA